MDTGSCAVLAVAVAKEIPRCSIVGKRLNDFAIPDKLTAEGKRTLKRLNDIADKVEVVKQKERQNQRERLKQELLALKEQDSNEFDRLCNEVLGS